MLPLHSNFIADTAAALVIAGESRAELEILLAGYLEYFDPADVHELSLVLECTESRWRLQRAARLEASLLNAETERLLNEPGATLSPDGALAAAFIQLTRRGGALLHLHRDESRLRKSFEKVYAELIDIAHYRNVREEAAALEQQALEQRAVEQHTTEQPTLHPSDIEPGAEPPMPAKPGHPRPVPVHPYVLAAGAAAPDAFVTS